MIRAGSMPSSRPRSSLLIRRRWTVAAAVLELLATSAQVRDAAHRFRAGVADRLEAWQSLIACLADEGVPQTHANISALSARVFRPGSGTTATTCSAWPWNGGRHRRPCRVRDRPSRVCAFLAKGRSSPGMLESIASRPEDEIRRPGRNSSSSACCGRELTRVARKHCERPTVSRRTRLSRRGPCW